MLYIVECLTLRTWFQSVFPYLLRTRVRAAGSRLRGLAFDASPAAMIAARGLRWLTGVSMDTLRFRLIDVRDEQGRLIRLRVLYEDLAKVQEDAMTDVQKALGEIEDAPRLRLYLAKALATSITSPDDRQTLWRALLTIQVCVWTARRESEREVCYFLERRPWFRAIRDYAARVGVRVIPIAPTFRWRTRVRYALPLTLRERIHSWHRWFLSAKRLIQPAKPARGLGTTAVGKPLARLAVEYYGHLNLAHPEQYSNLFFWQQSSLRARQIVVTFNLPQDPLDEHKWLEMTEQGIAAIALRPEATTLPWTSACFSPSRRHQDAGQGQALPVTLTSLEHQWLKTLRRTYVKERSFWTDFFTAQQIQMYVSWFKLTETSCAIADALHHLGGITAFYQRSFETHPSAESRVAADILFGCSPMTIDVERQSQSVIPYVVVTGYLGDHRARLWQAQAQTIRQQFHQRGASQILAYCDENSSEETRWGLGHTLMREAYAFLLERVLEEPWLGLILKPKTPHTLYSRLGPVATLLKQAEATGRCLIFEHGWIQGSTPPVGAALASDVMVHGHLWAATAGVESALAGVPTLLMDREGWPASPFYRLGVGRVVFTDWPSLWAVWQEHRSRSGGIPGFGDWSSMVEELDPFRDGCAAERMGTYLQWLLEGFDAGWNRDAVMAVAAERYVDRWGADKILHLNTAAPTAGRRLLNPVEEMFVS